MAFAPLKLGKDVLLFVFEEGIKEIPFGEAVTKLVERVREAFDNARDNDELVSAAQKRFEKLMDVVSVIQNSNCCENPRAFQDFYVHLQEFQRMTEKWTQKGWCKKFWCAKDYKDRFEELFRGLESNTHDLTLLVVAEAKVVADAAFKKAEEEREHLLREVEQIGQKAENTHKDLLAKLDQQKEELKRHISKELGRQAHGQGQEIVPLRHSLEELRQLMDLSMQDLLRELHERLSDFAMQRESDFTRVFRGVLAEQGIQIDQIRDLRQDVLRCHNEMVNHLVAMREEQRRLSDRQQQMSADRKLEHEAVMKKLEELLQQHFRLDPRPGPDPQSPPPSYTETELNKLTVVKLKDICRKHGIKMSERGEALRKPELVKRILEKCALPAPPSFPSPPAPPTIVPTMAGTEGQSAGAEAALQRAQELMQHLSFIRSVEHLRDPMLRDPVHAQPLLFTLNRHDPRHNVLPAAELLIRAGCALDTRDDDGRTALYQAIDEGSSEYAMFLIASNADVHALDGNGLTPLHEAAMYGMEDVAQRLVEAGALVDVRAPELFGGPSEGGVEAGWTPLMFAACQRKPDVVKMLIDNNANVSAEDDRGNTALVEACNICDEDTERMVSMLLEAGAKAVPEALLRAVDRRDGARLAAMLLEKNANPNVKYGGTPVLIHACKRQETGDVAMALVEAGADVNAADTDGTTPLLHAVTEEFADVAQLLLEQRADPNVKDADGTPVLTLACRIHDFVNPAAQKMGMALVKAGANVNAADKDGITPLLHAISSTQETVALLLLENGADVNCVDKDGNDAMALAESIGLVLSVRLQGALRARSASS